MILYSFILYIHIGRKERLLISVPCVLFDVHRYVNVTFHCLSQSLRNMMTANTTDACETRDPCQHGGICISTDSGPICECRSGDYEGAYCEKGRLFYILQGQLCCLRLSSSLLLLLPFPETDGCFPLYLPSVSILNLYSLTFARQLQNNYNNRRMKSSLLLVELVREFLSI